MMKFTIKIAFLFVLATSAVTSASASRKLHRRPDSERQLGPLPARRKLTEEDVFTRAFTVITSPKDITFVLPPSIQSPGISEDDLPSSVQGSYIITYGGVYRSSSVELVPKFLISIGGPQVTLQPKTTPSIDEDFTFGGKCTATNGGITSGISSHSCFYDLCLGSPTDCINIYAGGRFNFRPITSRSENVEVNIQNNGLLNPESDGLNGDLRSALPPSFPGFGFGGTGRYNGIKCNFDLITVAQRSIFALPISTGAPTSSPTLTDEPTENRDVNRVLSQEEEQEEEEDNRELQRVFEDDFLADLSGVIVQKIFFTCNQRLPLGPKAI